MANETPHRANGRRAALSRREARATDEAKGFPDDARLVDLQTIAAAAGTSLRTAQGWVASGRLRALRLGRSVRVRVSEWRDFLERCQAP
jgi:excisionase family DNA binding protein